MELTYQEFGSISVAQTVEHRPSMSIVKSIVMATIHFHCTQKQSSMNMLKIISFGGLWKKECHGLGVFEFFPFIDELFSL